MVVHKKAEEILCCARFSLSLLCNFVPAAEPIHSTIVEGTQNNHSLNNQSPGRIAWIRFRSNPLAMIGLGFIAILVLISALGPFIRPDSTIDANDQMLAISRLKPGSSIREIRIKRDVPETSLWQMWLDGGKLKEYTSIPIDSTIADEQSILYWPVGDIHSEGKTVNKDAILLNSDGGITFTRTFLLGTDKYGRDLLSRLMAGTVISLAVGAIAVFISLLIGLTLGLVAGYFRGKIDSILMWFTNVVWAVPTLILVMAITFAFGTGFWKVFLAVGLTMWVEVARIARGQVLSIREKEYIEAARAMGFSEIRIIFNHVLPNILSPIIVISAANFASAILIEAGLSFLGLGAQIPTPSWGNMIREHYAFITTDLAYLALVPGIMIMLLVLAFMMVGNGLRDALDVRE
jgi:peptide/nickel transport system permease protein